LRSCFSSFSRSRRDERDVALKSRCPDDAEVRAEVEKLLSLNGGAGEELSKLGRDFGSEPSIELTRQFIGQRVGCYEILDLIGQGGMGVIYRARDVRLSRPAALKAILPGSGHASAARLERLRREARVLASISHPNIATIYGLEESHDTLFIAMELIEGKTLSQRLGRIGMLVPEALATCEKIAAGVEAAHEAGVVHRDLKPGNVMFTGDGAVKVLDFGLARELKPEHNATLAGDDATRGAPLTRNGSFFGTPAYMSPEQARGEPLDRRSDIFSFGSILFRCLTGRPAFDGEGDAETIDGILNRDPDWSRLPENTPPALLKVLRRCLAKDPADRYRDIGDVRLELRELIDSRDEAWATPRPKRWRLAPGSIAALAACVALLAVVWSRHGAGPAPVGIVVGLTRPGAAARPGAARERGAEGSGARSGCAGARRLVPHRAVPDRVGTGAVGPRLRRRRVAAHRRTLGAHRPFLSPDGQVGRVLPRRQPVQASHVRRRSDPHRQHDELVRRLVDGRRRDRVHADVGRPDSHHRASRSGADRAHEARAGEKRSTRTSRRSSCRARSGCCTTCGTARRSARSTRRRWRRDRSTSSSATRRPRASRRRRAVRTCCSSAPASSSRRRSTWNRRRSRAASRRSPRAS
jgi:serine/threonine protein kinase